MCRASAVVERIGMKGVSASDNRGLHNQDPTIGLPAKESLLEGGKSACQDSLARQLSPLLERALLFRAAKAQKESKPIVFLGNLLLAYDCHAIPSSLPE